MHPQIALLFLLTTLWSAAQETDPAVIELRETISKIVDTQTLETKERLDWQIRKAEMQALLELHQRELALLDEELEKAGQSAPGHEGSTESLKSEIEALKASRRATAEAVARNVPRAIALAKHFPTPLLKDTGPELAALGAWKPSNEPREALQSIISLLAKAHQFNRRLTRVSEIRDNREVEVLYLGLARAFYADRKGNAGIGQPGPDGWTWQARPEIHSELTTALATLDKKLPPTMVKLPLEIK
ncbi:MAG: DUF3450 family protein [Luteolibacter sp.]